MLRVNDDVDALNFVRCQRARRRDQGAEPELPLDLHAATVEGSCIADMRHDQAFLIMQRPGPQSRGAHVLEAVVDKRPSGALPSQNVDSLRNKIANPVAGLLLVVNRKDETVWINGRAVLTTGPNILDGFANQGRRPNVVKTDELFGHCAKARRRGHVWDPAAWSQGGCAPDLAEIYGCQFDNIDADTTRAASLDHDDATSSLVLFRAAVTA